MFSKNEERVPLTGAGCFLRTIDRETRRFNDASHLSQLVLRLGGTVDSDRFRKFVRELFRNVPRLSAPIRRPYGIGYPSYCVPRDGTSRANVIKVHRGSDPSSGPSVPVPVTNRLNSILDLGQGQLVAVDLVRSDEEAVVALSWAHMLFDGYGIEVFVDRLAEVLEQWNRTGQFSARPFRSDVPNPLNELVEEYSWAERLNITRDWSDYITSLTDGAPASLSGPLKEEEQNLKVDVNVYDPDRTETIKNRATDLAGHMRPMMFYLAVTMRAHFEVLKSRDRSVPPLLVPVAVNMRGGTDDPLFGTQVSFLWFRATSEDLSSLEGLVDHLKDQRLEMIKHDLHEKTAVALETVKYCPTWIYRRLIRDPFEGEMASFFFSYTGEFLPDVTELFGREVKLGLHTPGVPPSPGSSLIVSLHRGRLTLSHVHQEGLLTAGEKTLFLDRLESDLEGLNAGAIQSEV